MCAYKCEAHELSRKHTPETQNKDQEDHIAERGLNSWSHYNLEHKFIPAPQAMKIPDAKAAIDKEWEKLENTPAWQESKIYKLLRGDR